MQQEIIFQKIKAKSCECGKIVISLHEICLFVPFCLVTNGRLSIQSPWVVCGYTYI